MRLRRPGGGHDRLTLEGRILLTLAQLGLPGHDVTVSLTNGGPPFFSITVPASALVPNGSGTKLAFRGTIGGALVRLRLGGRRRTDVSLSARSGRGSSSRETGDLLASAAATAARSAGVEKEGARWPHRSSKPACPS